MSPVRSHDELASAPERIAAIARDYAAKPENTIIVSPDNRSRQQINEAVRGELLKAGTLAEDGGQFLTLSHRSDMTGADRTWAAMYRPGDVVQYERGSKAEGIDRGSFGVVRSSDAATNRLTVELSKGSSVEYDPKRVYGVSVYRETSREFERIAEMFPNADFAAKVRVLRDAFRLRYEEWQFETYGKLPED